MVVLFGCILLISGAFALSLPLTWIMRSMAKRMGQLDAPGERKIHQQPIPVTGGIAIFWSFATPMMMGIIMVLILPDGLWDRFFPGDVNPMKRMPMGLTFIIGLLILHVMGVIDDRRNLGPYIKLLIQLLVSGVLAFGFGVRSMEWLDIPALGPLSMLPSALITMLWFVTMTNAFNFLDNMDGLSAGLAVICGGMLLTTALINGQWFMAFILALLIGATLGFLVFNFPPASIFMGDGGSLVLGFSLAFCSVRVTYHNPDPNIATPWFAVFTPLVILAVPLYDITSVTIIRMFQGKSPFKGDTQHFSHRLVKKGLSRRAAVIIIYACAIATGIGGLTLGALTEDWQGALVITQCALILLVLALLERTPDHPDAELK